MNVDEQPCRKHSARSRPARARISDQITTTHVWACACGSHVSGGARGEVVRIALDHADHCIESDHEGEA